MWPLPRQLSLSLACQTKLFLSSGLFAFMSSHFHSLCWPEHKGQNTIGVVFTWGPSVTPSGCVVMVFPFEGGFTLGGGLELRCLSGIDPFIRPYVVFANKAFPSTKPATKYMKVGSVPARVNEPALSAHLDCRWAGRRFTTFTRLSELLTLPCSPFERESAHSSALERRGLINQWIQSS